MTDARWRSLAAGLLLSALPLLASAQTGGTGATPAGAKPTPRPAEEAHRKDDIAKHRQMARAHEDAASCLESGEKEASCQERLREACKGIAVGRFCGLRHGH